MQASRTLGVRTALVSRQSIVVGATVLLIAYLARDALAEWYARTTEPQYSHLPLVLVVCAYLFWRNRPTAASTDRSAWNGVLLTLLGGTAMALGELSALWTIVQYGMVLVLAGIAWAHYGRKTRQVAFPLLLLFTVIPLPYMVDVMLSGKMQLLSSQLGVSLLRMLGTSVFLDGNVIDLGTYKLQVAEACNGLNYMFPLFTIGLMFMGFHRGPLPYRGAVVLSTIPITVGMNSARIAMVGILVNQSGIGAAEGFMHYFEGWVVFLLCLVLLYLEVRLINGLLNAPVLTLNLEPFVARTASRRNTARAITRPLAISAACAIAASLLVHSIGTREEVPPDRTTFFEFPTQVGTWQGTVRPFENKEDIVLGLDDYVQADFYSAEGIANLYVGYVNSQRKGFVPHSPRACIPGGGWEISAAGTHLVPVPGGTLKVTRLLISKGDQKQLVYYWFRQRGRDMSGEYSMKLYLLLDSIRMNRTDGSLVRVVVPVRDGTALAESTGELFIAQIYPLLPRFVPD